MDESAADPSFTPAVILYLVSSPLYSSAVELSFLYICCFIHVQITLFYTYMYISDPLIQTNTPPLLFSTMGGGFARGRQSWRCAVENSKQGRQAEIFNLLRSIDLDILWFFVLWFFIQYLLNDIFVDNKGGFCREFNRAVTVYMSHFGNLEDKGKVHYFHCFHKLIKQVFTFLY